MKQKVQQNNKRKLYGKSRNRLTKKGKIKRTVWSHGPKHSSFLDYIGLEDLK